MLDALKSLAQSQADDQMKIYQTIIDGSIMAANAIKTVGNKGVSQVFNLKPPQKKQQPENNYDDPLDEPMIVGQQVDLGRLAQKQPIYTQPTFEQRQKAPEPAPAYEPPNGKAQEAFDRLNDVTSALRKEKSFKEKAVVIASDSYNAIDHFRGEMEKMTTNVDIIIKQFQDLKNDLYERQMAIYQAIAKMEKE